MRHVGWLILACIVLDVSTGLTRRAEKCWSGDVAAEKCCNRQHGPEGFASCWGDGYDYALCCTLPAPAPAGGSQQNLTGSHWCGPVCMDPPEGRDRPWEALRNILVADATSSEHPERLRLAAMDSAINRVLAWTQADLVDLAGLCQLGVFAIRLLRAAALEASSDKWAVEGGGSDAFEALEVANELVECEGLLSLAMCSGWPIFRIMSLAASNSSTGSKQLTRLMRQFFETKSGDDLLRGGFAAAVKACIGAANPLDTCFAAARPQLEQLHYLQHRLFLGAGDCPRHAFAVWLDRMAPAPTFPLCVRREWNTVDFELRTTGSWAACSELQYLASLVASPGCTILDVGANIGTCAIMLGHLGYHVVAFEPLPQNARLLEASLQMNPTVNVSLHRVALGDRKSDGIVMEGRGNAGMSTVVPTSLRGSCDRNSFHCDHTQSASIVPLDEFWRRDLGEICLAKIDVEGNELRVLRGALRLLRERFIGALYLEWWPPHLRALGEEPLALPWLLHALEYEVYAPARWFTHSAEDLRWLRVVPDEFPFLLKHWGDLVARPVARKRV